MPPRNSKYDRFVEIELVNVVVDTTAYAQYDSIAALGLPPEHKCIRLADVARENGMPVKLDHISLTEEGAQTPAFSMYFFSSMPTGTFTDNSAVVWSVGDSRRRTGCVRIVSGDWHTQPTTAPFAMADLSAINELLTPVETSRDLWLVMVADAAYDAVAGNDFVIKLKFDRGTDK